MSTRQRPRSSESADPSTDTDAEFGFVSDADIAAYLADQELEDETEAKKDAGFLNLQTASGLGLIGVGALYALQQVGFLPLGLDLRPFIELLPILASVLIMLTGFGVLSWSPTARRRRKARARAAKARTQARKTMGRQPRRGGRSRAEEVGSAAGSAAASALGAAGRAMADAGRGATRAAEVAFAEQQARRRTQSKGRRKARGLTKDRRNRKISGVAAGIASYTGLDPTIVRIAFVALTVLLSGFGIPLYIVLAMVLKNEPRPDDDRLGDSYIRITDD